MEKAVQKFRQYCQDNGMRNTPERELIIKELYRVDEHFDVDRLFLRIRNRHLKLKLSKVSIYRAIPHLIKAGLIREAFSDSGAICYEHVLGHDHHDHMKCLKCGEVVEFYEKEIDEMQQKLCDKIGFEMVWHVHVIGGYCKKCRKLNRK
jgi:Fur family ferric uptake transcriptional regulator